jgi:hypothetical protein
MVLTESFRGRESLPGLSMEQESPKTIFLNANDTFASMYEATKIKQKYKLKKRQY